MKTWKDVYKLPLSVDKWDGRVYDNIDNFVFQFQAGNENFQEYVLDVINGDKEGDPTCRYRYEDQQVLDCFGIAVILIRGWGNLTGIGGFNLSSEEAVNIQDTFGEFIASRLSTNEDFTTDLDS